VIVSTQAGPAAAGRRASCPNVEHVIAIEPLKRMQSGTLAFHEWPHLVSGDAAAPVRSGSPRSRHRSRRSGLHHLYQRHRRRPRGVRQHHGAILCNVDGAAHVLAEDFGWKDEVFLSFLPLSHAYEHSAGQFLPIGMGGEIHYAEGLEKLARTSRKCARRSWSWCRACSKCCARDHEAGGKAGGLAPT
jgi:long-chain acyl-CoA synthetase